MYSKLSFIFALLLLLSFSNCQNTTSDEGKKTILEVENNYYQLSIHQVNPQTAQGQAEGEELIQYVGYRPAEILSDLYQKQGLKLKSAEKIEALPKIRLNCRYQKDLSRQSISDSIAQQLGKAFDFEVIKGQGQQKALFLSVTDRALLNKHQVAPETSAKGVESKETLQGKQWTAKQVSLAQLRQRVSEQLDQLFFAEEAESSFKNVYNFELNFTSLEQLNQDLAHYGMKISEGQKNLETRVIISKK